MLRIVCDQRTRRGRLTRRELLRIGGLGAVSWAASKVRASEGPRSAGFGRAKSVILVYASGGQSHIDMWDPKPSAPADVRGEFRPISTAIAGVAFGEHMPQLARAARLMTVVRSMSHEDLDHGSATYLTLTGRYHQRLSSNPAPSPDDFPTYGAVLKRAHPSGRFLYDAVHVNGPALVPERPAPGQNGGLLGREYEPLVVGDVTQGEIAIPGLNRRTELPAVRLRRRRTLKESLDQYARQLSSSPAAEAMSGLYGQALQVLTSPQCRRAFDLSAEDPALRERYGRHRSGQACLLARRLVEAGVPLVTVIWSHSNRGQDKAPDVTDQYGWDTHNDIFSALRVHLLPRFDATLSTMLYDLHDRGLLDETLVVCMGEFGRAPKVALEPRFAGATPGRKHWSSVYSIALAGAGVSRGAVVGSSDRLGAEPTDQRYGPWDVGATMYSALGIDPGGHFVDALGRRFPLTIGQVIEPLYQG